MAARQNSAQSIVGIVTKVELFGIEYGLYLVDRPRVGSMDFI